MKEHFMCPLDCTLINPWITEQKDVYFYCTGCSPAEIVGSNPTGGMDICLL